MNQRQKLYRQQISWALREFDLRSWDALAAYLGMRLPHQVSRSAKLLGKAIAQLPGYNRPVLHVVATAPVPANREGRITAFYTSWEWKRLRYDFIKDRDRRCGCCGATPESGIRIVVDHIKPIRLFWELRLDRNNLQLLCDDCNMGKGSRDQTDWRDPATRPTLELLRG